MIFRETIIVNLGTGVDYEEELDMATPPCLPSRYVSVKISEFMHKWNKIVCKFFWFFFIFFIN